MQPILGQIHNIFILNNYFKQYCVFLLLGADDSDGACKHCYNYYCICNAENSLAVCNIILLWCNLNSSILISFNKFQSFRKSFNFEIHKLMQNVWINDLSSVWVLQSFTGFILKVFVTVSIKSVVRIFRHLL